MDINNIIIIKQIQKRVGMDIISEQHGKVNTRGHMLFSFQPSSGENLKQPTSLTVNNFVFV
jgi:hypothetical protein